MGCSGLGEARGGNLCRGGDGDVGELTFEGSWWEIMHWKMHFWKEYQPLIWTAVVVVVVDDEAKWTVETEVNKLWWKGCQ